MKKLLVLFLFANISYGQTITGGPLSPDLKSIKLYSLVELQYIPPKDPSNGKLRPITSIDWAIYTVNDKHIITAINSFQATDKCIFTGPPGNYLVHCNVIIETKLSHVNTNIIIPSNPTPTPPNPKPIPITSKVFAAMVADTSNQNYLNSPQALIWRSSTITDSLKNINVVWKHYDINSQVSNGKGSLIPLKDAPWGAAAIDLINKTNNMPALVLIDNQGNIITTIALQATEAEVISFIKGKLGVN